MDAPEGVVAALGGALGSGVARETATPTGYTPAVASILTLADGRSVFVKASDDPGLHEGLRNAVDCDRALTDRSLAPPVLAALTAGEWRIVAWECLPGGHVRRWSWRDVPAVLDLASRLAADTRPCRVPETEPFAHAFRDRIGTLQALAGGDHLHHGDVRRDNLAYGADGRLRLLDWTHRWTAPGWADLVLLMPDLIRDGLDAETILAASVWADAPAHEVNVLLAGLTGYWFNAGHRPDLPHAPGLRELQRAQGRACASWLAHRLRQGVGS